MKTRFAASVEACLENFLDCPHATTVHRGWFRSPTAKVIRCAVRTLDDGAAAEYFDEPREKSLVWTLLAPSSKHQMRHTDRFLAPATSEVDYQFTNAARYLITSCCTPVDDRHTDVYTVITFRFGWITPLVRLFFEPLARRVIRQDVDMLDQVEANVERFGRPRYQVIAQDLLLPHIVQWRNAMRSGAPPPAAGQENHVDLRL
jgi:phenylpropionate dioxygenase-like ring-hydroxylating dioxygenase large terminal subunit